MQKRFDAHLKPEGGRALVVGSAIIGGAAVLSGLLLSEPLLVFVALIAFAVSLYNYPLLVQDDAHLSASLQGLAIDGLGSMRWSSITSLTFDGQQTITLELNDKIDEAVTQAEDASALRTLQVSIWKQQGDQTLVLTLAQFKENPSEIHDAINRFHAQANV